jgi:hypothetical protein
MEPSDRFVPKFPAGGEQEKLDGICESCPHGFFRVKEPENPICPVCRKGLWDLDKAIIIEAPTDDNVGAPSIYLFKCPQCKRNVYSKTNLWA